MSRDLRKQLGSFTECSVCTETYNDPRILPCVHTYCLQCIKDFSNDKLPGDQVPCPICRKVFTLPDSGVDSLPKNFFIEQLKDLTDQSNRHCEECSDDVTDPTLRKQAVMYCVECQQRFCESCTEIHRKAKISREHKLIDCGDNHNIRVAVKEMKIIFCNKHPNRAVEAYCTICKEAICMMCFIKLHKSHDCTDVNEVIDEFRQRMTNDVKSMNDTIKICHDALKEQKTKKDDFSKMADTIEQAICMRAEQLKNMIEAERLKLLNELASHKADRIKQMQHVTESIEQRALFVGSLVKYTEELRDNGAASDVAQQARTLHERADELMNIDDVHRDISSLGSVEISFEEAKVPAKAADRLIGAIKWLHVRDGDAECSEASSALVQRLLQAPVPIQLVQSATSSTPTLTHVICADDERKVVGVTSVDNRLFVLRSPSQQRIQIYDLKTFTLQQEILEVTGLSDEYMNELTACVINKCLYVSDQDKDNVYKVQLTADNKIFKWSVGRGPIGLSINSECNLLVACFCDRKIQEYNTRGLLVREIRITSNNGDLLRPRHVIQMTNDQYVVGCRDDGDVDDVVEVDVKGRIAVSYKNQLQSTAKQNFSWPRHLAVNKNKECIIVADSGNNRIVILNRSLNCRAREFNVSSVDGGLREPSRLHFNESQGRLFVGECGDRRRVVVFDRIINIASCFQ